TSGAAGGPPPPSFYPEPLAPSLVASGREPEDTDQEALDPESDRTRHRAVTGDRRLQLALEPALELGEIRECQRLQFQEPGIVVTAPPQWPQLGGVPPFQCGSDRAEGVEAADLRPVGVRGPNHEALLERLVEDRDRDR